MNSPTEPLVQSASGPSADRRRLRRSALLLRAGALTTAALLTLATFGAAPAAAEPDGRHRDGWRDRHDRHDRDRWRHDDRRRDHRRWEKRDHRRDHRRWERRDRGHDRRRWERHDRGRGRGHHRFERPFRVPARIDSFRHYEPYHYGRVYYPAHRHHHRILAFPRDVRGAARYVPYAYCGDALFGSGAFFYDGPRLSIRWSF